MEETGLVLRPFVSPWAIALLACVLVGVCVLAYVRTPGALAGRFRALLIALRAMAVAAAGVALLRPSLEVTHHEVVRRPLLLLVDASRSMREIRDMPGGRSRSEAADEVLARNADELEALEGLYDVTVLRFGRGLLGRGADDDDATGARYSAYGLAMEQAFDHVAAGQADALVVIGDGAHNLGPPDPVDVAGALNAQGVPVHTIGMGEEQDPSAFCDVRIVEVTAPPTAFVFAALPIRVQMLLRGCRGRTVPVRMQFGDQPPQERVLTAAHDEELIPLEFEAVPEAVGEQKVTVRAEPMPDELLVTNNAFTTYVRVGSEGVRVGLFDTLRPESKFIAHALTGAEHVALRRVLVLPGQSPPSDVFDAARYDVVMLGDLGPTALVPSRVLALKTAVQEDGKGLIVLFAGGGERAGEAFSHTAMQDLLPVRLGGDLRPSEGMSQLVPAPAHAGHPVLALAPTPEETAARWRGMPPLTGTLTGAEPKRGATVVAQDDGGRPLLVVHRAGAGRVACVLCDTTFRWFFTERDTQDAHRRFWRQLVLWAGGSAKADDVRLRLDLSRQRLLMDEAVTARVHVSDADGVPLREAEVSIQVTDPRERTVALSPVYQREAAAFEAEFSPALAGEYTVEATARRGAAHLGRERAHFQVSSPDAEVEDPLPDLALLRRVSAATGEAGGRYVHHSRADSLFAALRKGGAPLTLTTRRRADVWDSWPLFAVFGACLAAEWAVRKWRGLP